MNKHQIQVRLFESFSHIFSHIMQWLTLIFFHDKNIPH